MFNGLFVTLEGGEGSGKSTLISSLEDTLSLEGYEIVVTREPGGTPGAEKIRDLLVKGDAGRWDAISEICLFYAARQDHIQRLIKPAIKSGKIVLCDRFYDSTRAYQGNMGPRESEIISCLEKNIVGDMPPDLTLILDIDVKTGLKRAFSRHNDESRFESKDISFHENLRQAYLEIARQEPDRCKVIDASQSPQKVFADAIACIGAKLLHLRA